MDNRIKCQVVGCHRYIRLNEFGQGDCEGCSCEIIGPEKEAKMFEDAKVGDRVWDVRLGYGTVYELCSLDYPIAVEFKNRGHHKRTYTFEGKDEGSDFNPTLFWDEVKITPPPNPKKEVVVEGWINLYPTKEFLEWRSHEPAGLYKTKELADEGADKTIRLGEAVYIKHTYRE